MRPAECLVGLDLPGGWHVESFVHRPPNSTGGHFSVGYLVVNKDGRSAYLKALDFSGALQSEDASRALEALTKAYNFERDLLAQCKRQRLGRVVTPLADGSVIVPGVPGDLSKVQFLIFELATGDIRNEIAAWKAFDLAWVLRSLHHTAVGLSQLHTAGIAHQDLKPSNVLVFSADGSKIADLGRASHKQISCDTDNLDVPGDTGYAPPEQAYGWRCDDAFASRCIGDLYHLGSLIIFYFLRCSATHAIVLKISQKHAKGFVSSDFLQDLPYFQHAFGEVLADLRVSVRDVAGEMTDSIVTAVKQLCEPDPLRRGDPQVRSWAHVPKYDLQPYISRFDLLAQKAEMRML